MRQFAVPVVACVVMAAVAHASDKGDSSQEFIKAAELTDIRSPDGPPFELDAKVEIRGNDSNFIPGKYKLTWVSLSEWREELSFSGYSRIRVGGHERYWQQRSLGYEPLQITELDEALDFVSSLRDEKSPGKLKSRKESGMLLDCAEGGGPRKREYCFDGSESVLVLEDAADPLTDYRFRYSEFETFGQRRFPGRIDVRVGQTIYAAFSVERLISIEKPVPADFVPPVGLSLWLTCPNPQKPHLTHSVQPVYPEQEKRAHHQGTVAIYAVIVEGGSPQNLQVLETPSKELADAALAAVRQWRYEPKRCPEGATPTEATLHVVFMLGP
jgi:TonB family protein